MRKLLISGERADFTTLALDLDRKELSILANYAAPFNASWVELSSSQGSIDRLVGLSEGNESGLLYIFEIDHAQKTCKITSQQPTMGAPGHFTTLRDGSALALATYLGGSVAIYPISHVGTKTLLLKDVRRTEILPKFPYESVGQDLGSDRVWILHRDGMELDICGWLQCPPGTGPRHAVLTPDETVIYVIGELSHTVLAFDLSDGPAEAVPPIDNFAPNIIPPTVHPDHQSMMDSAELCLHPSIPNVLYVSNRWERHISQREPQLRNVPKDIPPGDDVAIILLSDDGRKVEAMKHVRTNVDVIRGMRLSNDGKYVVVVGQEGGGVEVYEISGVKGDVWTLVASLKKGLESGIKHAIWL
ncbi:putative isomerase YbhE [Aspergillus ambiguus]|uniref:putative isomerase YbhE n=1 Tax=Aspergillus ambiguus TaxID=176160 RepID=UPI003CCE0117